MMLLNDNSSGSMEKALQWCTLINQLYELLESAESIIQRTGHRSGLCSEWQNLFDNATKFIGIKAIRVEVLPAIVLEAKPEPVNERLNGLLPDESIYEITSDPFQYYNERYVYKLTAEHAGSFIRWQTERIKEFSTHCFQCLSFINDFSRFNSDIEVLYKTLNHVGFGIILFDSNGWPVFSNSFAAELNDRYDDFKINKFGVSYYKNGNDCLAKDKKEYDQSFFVSSIKAKRLYYKPLTFTFLNLHSDVISNVICQKINYCLILDEEKINECAYGVHGTPNSIKYFLKITYNLTPKEIDLAYNLSLGMPIYKYSELIQRSVLTVRTHKKSIYKKLNISDIKELIKLIWENDVDDYLNLIALSVSHNTPFSMVYPEPYYEDQ